MSAKALSQEHGWCSSVCRDWKPGLQGRRGLGEGKKGGRQELPCRGAGSLESRLDAATPSTVRRLAAWHGPWWECLHHGNGQMPQIGAFLLESPLSWVDQHPARVGHEKPQVLSWTVIPAFNLVTMSGGQPWGSCPMHRKGD